MAEHYRIERELRAGRTATGCLATIRRVLPAALLLVAAPSVTFPAPTTAVAYDYRGETMGVLLPRDLGEQVVLALRYPARLTAPVVHVSLRLRAGR